MNTRRLSPWHSLRLLALTLAALAVLPGCAQLQSVDTVSASDFPVTGLLYYSRALLMADATGRAALLDGAKQAYAEQPDAIATARLALAYGQPGYTGYAPENGWRYAHKALQAEDQAWGPAAKAFLQQFEQLCKDNHDIRKHLKKARKSQHHSTAQIADLRKQLAAANAKLQALTRIESKLNP